MAARLIVLYSQPEEPELFDAHYHDVHTPIVRRYPRIRGIRLTKGAGVGARLGVNVGYLKFTPEATWNPF